MHRIQKQSEIKLPPDLKAPSITAWGKAVMDFETTLGPFPRESIEIATKEIIADRWTDEIYVECLPVILNGQTTRSSWMDPEVISTKALVDFLVKTAKRGRGSTYGQLHYQ